ncbi:MAG: 50S ribosomal protein L10 [Ignavibacteriaceae bacterium]|jgi:large subunit ribosomal protein L10|nr:50S ribosomal protein L10 [Ignavibacteriaceae bacterium]MCW8813728.1 50S ribosomal protein L10 [Chlorobium sp.]MCW8816636.1 50S ribosomal protein L10 [Ignavibacteriaceae bacterium]MCW8961966.1 50S ribosomal protein L10 [Ignavibacteriaceae bacterium]
MNRNEKSEIISEIKELLESSTAIYLTDYRGINVEDVSELRNQFRNEGVRYKVFKNTLVKRALDEAGKYEKIADHLTGMTGFAFASTNPLAPAKIINKYFSDKEKLSLKACYVEGEYFDGTQLKTLATLPSKNELIAGILGSINSPISGIAGAINAVFRDLVSVVDQISQRQAA